MLKRAIATATLASLAFFATPSAAQAEYPGIVQADLKLTGMAPKCNLCHMSENGGDSRNRFGQLLESYGLNSMSDDPASLHVALGMLEVEEPQAVVDLMNGVDPVQDNTLYTDQETPAYGCAVSAEARVGSVRSGSRGSGVLTWPAWMLFACAGSLMFRGRRPGRIFGRR